MPEPVEGDATHSTTRRIVGGVLLLVLVGAALLLPLRSGDDDSGASQDPSSPAASPSPTASVTSDDDFCAAFRALADAQAGYVADESTRDGLETAAREIAALGVPESMSTTAVGGWVELLRGVFESIGATPPDGTVLSDPTVQLGPGAQQAFGSYITQYCPA